MGWEPGMELKDVAEGVVMEESGGCWDGVGGEDGWKAQGGSLGGEI